MGRIVFLLLLSFSAPSLAGASAQSIALEGKSLKLDYIETSGKGYIRLYGCDRCSTTQFTFTSIPKVRKQGNEVPFTFLQKDYWNATYPTIFLDPKSNAVVLVNY